MLLAEQVRSGVSETLHHGAVAIVDRSGVLVASAGDIERQFFFRSAAKPFQAAIALLHGGPFPSEHLALACASHDGEPVHRALVAELLAGGGLSENNLQCPADWPLRGAAMRRAVASGQRHPRRLYHNCSGKHAAMLRAAVARDWPIDTYLDPGHPLQVEILEFMVEVAGVDRRVGVDGCGAPVFLTNVLGMARAFARLATDQTLSPVYDAMHSYPALVSGVANADAAIARNLGAAAKRGALGTLGVAMPSFGGLAVKCWDGNDRVAGVAAIAALDQMGAVPLAASEALEPYRRPAVTGGIRPVGAIETRLELKWQ